jgi:hypothetical protein
MNTNSLSRIFIIKIPKMEKKVIKVTENQLNVLKSRLREQEEKTNNTTGMEEMASALMASQTQVHIFHLQTKSYAEHKALQGYYEDIDDLMDSLIEAYQGQFGIIENYQSLPISKYEGKEQIISYFEDLMSMIEKNREGLPSHLQNIVDTIVELITSTLYKIKFLA